MTIKADILRGFSAELFRAAGLADDKAEAVAKGVAGAPAGESSAARVMAEGRTLWLVDEAAASRRP